METVSCEWWERKWELGGSVSKEILQSGMGHTLLKWGWRKNVSAQLGCKWFQRPLTLKPGPKPLASFPLSWRQSFVQVSEMDERWRQTELERNQAVVCSGGRHTVEGCKYGCGEVRVKCRFKESA